MDNDYATGDVVLIPQRGKRLLRKSKVCFFKSSCITVYITTDRHLDPVYSLSQADSGPALNEHIYLSPPDSQHNLLQTTPAGVLTETLQRVLCRHVCSDGG